MSESQLTLPRLSFAQTCNEDVLGIIFEASDSSTLAAAGRVCRSWTVPAQRALFAVVYMDDGVVASTLGKLELLQWLPLLPQDGLVSAYVSARPDAVEALGALVKTCDALRTARRLFVRWPADIIGGTDGMNLYLSSGRLGHLGLMFTGTEQGPPLQPQSCNTLPRLSIKSWSLVDDIPNIINACSSNLRRLDLHFMGLKDGDYPLLISALRAATRVVHLTLPWEELYPIPLLEDSVPYMPQLQHLRAGPCLYTGQFLSCIPATLETLHLEYGRRIGNTEPFPTDAAVFGLSTHPALTLFKLGPAHRSLELEFPGIREVCACRGITYIALPWPGNDAGLVTLFDS
ncbi:hypothetical protein B0H19DRAFT_1259684 [Mycena capillaripes]|nr:hypothetical protein B0H19DRAFT_1259684 [Mycena capillaripes]